NCSVNVRRGSVRHEVDQRSLGSPRHRAEVLEAAARPVERDREMANPARTMSRRCNQFEAGREEEKRLVRLRPPRLLHRIDRHLLDAVEVLIHPCDTILEWFLVDLLEGPAVGYVYLEPIEAIVPEGLAIGELEQGTHAVIALKVKVAD